MFDDNNTDHADRYDDSTAGLLDPAFDELFEDKFSAIAHIDAAMDIICLQEFGQ